jgi:pimeloyl-ACP methyl ester carboxylesterase
MNNPAYALGHSDRELLRLTVQARLHDKLVPLDQGRRLAASIPNARFVALDSANHALLSREPAWEKFAGDMQEFLADGG